LTASDVYYDPYNVNTNADPYPVYRRRLDGGGQVVIERRR
jgi:hypothetical protein